MNKDDLKKIKENVFEGLKNIMDAVSHPKAELDLYEAAKILEVMANVYKILKEDNNNE